MKFLVLPVTEKLSKWIELESQTSVWEIVAVKNTGISRLQILKAFGLDLHLSLFVTSFLTNACEIHHWV